MDSFAELNKIGSSAGLETVRLTDVPTNKPFLLTSMKRVDTCYGQKILCTCEQFKVFLPSRFSSMSEESINTPEKQPTFIKYKGMQNGACIIEFVKGDNVY